MPYIKGKGVKDIYLIKIARIGTKAEIHPKSNDKEPRLVFFQTSLRIPHSSNQNAYKKSG